MSSQDVLKLIFITPNTELLSLESNIIETSGITMDIQWLMQSQTHPLCSHIFIRFNHRSFAICILCFGRQYTCVCVCARAWARMYVCACVSICYIPCPFVTQAKFYYFALFQLLILLSGNKKVKHYSHHDVNANNNTHTHKVTHSVTSLV